MKKTEQHEEDQNGEEGPDLFVDNGELYIGKEVEDTCDNKDRSREFQVLADNMERLVQDIAYDRVLLETKIDGLYSCISDQHEINQMLTDRLFILENHNELNADKSASIH